MILSQNRKPVAQVRSEGWLLAGLLAVLLLGLLYILLHYRSPGVTLAPGEVVTCDAERTRGDHFVNGGQQFSKGSYQSREEARSGWYSCRVPEGEGAQYGFGYKLENAQPGEVYLVKVWRYKNTLNEGKLAVRGNGTPGFYQETAEVRELADGWEALSVTFHIPYDEVVESANIYVYTNGYQPVFFDDLQIERIDIWDRQVFQPEVLDLEIGARDRQKLAEKRDEAIRTGILFTDQDDWVNGRIQDSAAAPIPVRLRLKGDWLDHLSENKWSFRLKVRDPYEWKHLKVFSLHTPAARYHLHEWVLHQLWEQEDILTTRYDLIELKIDGESRGIYAWEEHFAKQLVESRRRREGPILKLDEEGLWLANQRQLAGQGFIAPGAYYSAADWQNADITAFEEEELAADTSLQRLLGQAKALLGAYLKGEMSAERVFDLDRLAAYYAICDVLNAYHGIVWHNQRFYYNPLTDRLEPIGFDGFGGPPEAAYTFLGEGALNPQSLVSDNIYHRLFQDAAFTGRYVQKLYHYSSPAFFDTFLDSLQAGWTARKQWLQMEFPAYHAGLPDLRERARFVHSLVLPFEGQSLKARHLPGPGVTVSNTHTLPLEVIGWATSAKSTVNKLAEPLLLPGQMPRAYMSRLRADSLVRDFAGFRYLEEAALKNQRIPLWDTLSLPVDARVLYYRPLGLDTLLMANCAAAEPVPENHLAAAFQGQDLELQPFFSVDGRLITFFPGQHQVRKSIYIPAGYEVEFPAGTQLDLQSGAAFFSRSPVQATGDPEAPVRIYSSDGSGSGFTVFGAEKTSTFKNVDFSGLNTFRSGNWQLTGAVTFYESSVRFYRCRFANNHCEDALNVVRSEFQLEACRFDGIFSDAFDSDFSKGEVRNCAFLRTGNDGLDVSGSVVNVYECEFDTNGDKGISVGEQSDLYVFNSSFRNAPIAMASKDLSFLYVRNARLADCKQGFAAFQKKPEFGGATILVESYKADNVGRLYVQGEGSHIQIGGVE